LSVNFVEKQALLCGFAVERVQMDYGIDLLLHTFNRGGEVENERVLFQLKSSDRIVLSREHTTASCRVDRSDLLYWLGETMPVILVLYDARNDRAWWVHVQDHMAGRHAQVFAGGRQPRLAIPTANVLDRKAMQLFARRKNAIVRALREARK
jgi:hypothetical protein